MTPLRSVASEAMPRVAGVAFDLDGLLVNTEELYQDVGAELLRRRGRAFEPELLDAMMGRPQRVSLAIMIEWHGLTDTVEALATETRQLFGGLLDSRLQTMPGARELLDLLDDRGFPYGLATSSGPEFAHDVLRRVGLYERFSFVLTSADIVEGKPHPEIYQKAAKRLGVATTEMLVLEDSQTGCRAAVAAGAVVVAVPGGHSRRHDFTGARLVADTLADPRIQDLFGG